MNVLKIGIISCIALIFACNDTYKGPYPTEPTCVQYPSNDTVELLNGIVKLEDTTFYISKRTELNFI